MSSPTEYQKEYPKEPGRVYTDQPLSDNERIKIESNFLRGTISEDIENQLTGGFNDDNIQLIKFHGLYQQDDRDIRAERKEQKLEPRHHFLMRARMPGGVCTPEQWLAIDKYASDLTMYGSIRLTTRQTFQYHGILKRNLRGVFQGLDTVGLDSIFTAGDVNRNTLCTSNPVESELHQEAYELANRLSEKFLPNTKGYADIWLDGEKVSSNEEESEPLYTSTYLPRKFKITVVIPPHNDVDMHANDISFVAISEKGKLAGFNVFVGGGLGMTFGNKQTYPRVADNFGFIKVDDVMAVAEAIVTTQRDYGNRSDRKLSKTKHTIETIGLEKFISEVEQRSGVKFEEAKDFVITSRGDRFGWIKGVDNKWHLTLYIESGRILDFPERPLKTGLRKIAEIHQGDFRLTANQNLIIAAVPESEKDTIETLAKEHGLLEPVTAQRQNSMACVALPTCPLAMAEAERYLPSLVDNVQGMLEKAGIPDEHIVMRVTGCPNGCGRAMLAEIGLVGKAPGRYNLYLGGDRIGSRVPKLYLENITEDKILSEIEALILRWSKEREVDECFGDFVIRAGVVKKVVVSARDFHD